jgi:hypothetical protein
MSSIIISPDRIQVYRPENTSVVVLKLLEEAEIIITLGEDNIKPIGEILNELYGIRIENN